MCVPRCAGRPAGQPLRGAVETGSRDRLEHARPRLLRFHAAMDLLRKALLTVAFCKRLVVHRGVLPEVLTYNCILEQFKPFFTTRCTPTPVHSLLPAESGVNAGTPRGLSPTPHPAKALQSSDITRARHTAPNPGACTCLTSPPLRTCTNRRPSRAVQAQRCSPWIWRLPSLHKQRTRRLTR